MRGDIRNWEDAVSSRCNWGWLDGCFGPTISPTDGDFIVERRGKVLFGEIKRTGQEVPRGQMILLEALHDLPRFTVFILEGMIQEHEIYEPMRIYKLGRGLWEPINRDGFRSFCVRWYAYANSEVYA
jgi:hypothetical protein